MKPDNALRSADWEVRVCGYGEALALVQDFHYSRSASNTTTYRHALYHRAAGILGHPHGAALWIPPTKAAAVRTVIDLEEHFNGELTERERRDLRLEVEHDGRWKGVLACSRLVVHPDVPTNGASFLLGRSMRMLDRQLWPILVTYADTRLGHTGAIYKATNWICLGEVMPGASDVWVHGSTGEQRGRKRGPTTWSAGEMRDAGFVPAQVLPKIKYAHVA